MRQISSRDRRVFVDAAAYLALLDRQDNRHVEAVQVAGLLARTGYRQLTSNIVVIETHALLMSHLDISVAAGFLRSIDRGGTTIVRARASDEERAKQIIYQYQDKDFSFTDAISFAIMERLHIPYAFTFDRHFAQFGFTVLSPDHF